MHILVYGFRRNQRARSSALNNLNSKQIELYTDSQEKNILLRNMSDKQAPLTQGKDI